jgi:hypothetical protein
MGQFTQTSETYTLFTKNTTDSKASGTATLYPGIDSRWTLARLELITAGGMVAIGFKQDINPPQAGKGRLLTAGRPIEIYVPPNQRLYYSADSTQRMAVSFEPLPWLQQILQSVSSVLTSMPNAVQAPIETMKEVVTSGVLVPAWRGIQKLGSKKISRALPGAPVKVPTGIKK